MSKAKRIQTLAERRADAYRGEALQLAHSMETIRRVEALRARLTDTAMCSVSGEAVEAVMGEARSNPNAKPLSYGMWKRYVDSLTRGYVLETLGSVVESYCVHCQQPFAVSAGNRAIIGTVVKYDSLEIEFDKFAGEWVEEEKENIRPATHAGMACPVCYLAYTKLDAETKRYRFRVRYTYPSLKRPLTVYANDLRHASELLVERGMGGVQIVDCKPIPQRTGFLDVRNRITGDRA